MSKKKSNKVSENSAGAYTHEQQATQRPDVGVQPEFAARKPPVNYRYDSSLAPELNWDENAERDMAEWLLGLIGEAAEKSEAEVFSEPQVWKGSDERFDSTVACVARIKSLTQPFLNWTGKAERQQISVPTIPLFVHERHSTQAILETLEAYKASGTMMDLFGDPELDITDKLDAYEHKGPWSNRMILGDSLQVMNSFLEYEGMGGQVQMIYMDPPYGVKFGSNFQPFVRKRSVKHNKDDEMIREPEMVKAYRDTWELGIHSYLTYMRDRLLLAKELITESGSIFVQISDENLHYVRELMDEVFGTENFMSVITFAKSGGGMESTSRISSRVDYLIWYAKDKGKAKYQPLYEQREDALESGFDMVELPDGTRRRVTKKEKDERVEFPEESKFFMSVTFSKPGPGSKYDIEHNGKVYNSGRRWWGLPKESLRRVIESGRTVSTPNEIRFVKYFSDFQFRSLSNFWDQLGGASNPLYVVQTNPLVIQRCMQMTTEPGDLVLDPNCGSGTTAYVAEQWGRRWITCDTSRVPLALARQRLLTSKFPWYELNEPSVGPSAGFIYEQRTSARGRETGGLVPKLTLKSIANEEDPETVTLVDRPKKSNKVTRVCGPFSVEATVQSASSIMNIDALGGAGNSTTENPRKFIDRMIEVLRQSKTLRLPGNKALEFTSVQVLPVEEYEYLHAVATEENGDRKRIAIVFGPEDGAINSTNVFEAAREAYHLKFDALYFFGFAIQAKARQLVDEYKKLKIRCGYVAVTPDVVMSDLLKTSKSSEIFSVTGLPDVKFTQADDKAANGDLLYQVELLGLDIFRPEAMETETIQAENMPCWMLDTDYNGMVFMARQVFFPKTSAWDNLQKSLKGKFDDSVWEHLAGTSSEPFSLGANKAIAVKVIDERGNELLVVREAAELNS